MTLGDFLRNYRNEHGYSLRAFSEVCGVSNAYLSMLEKGTHPTTGKPIVPTIRVMGQIAHSMDLTLDELLSRVDDMPVNLSEERARRFVMPMLSQEEAVLIYCYRAADPTTRNIVTRVLSDFYERGKEEMARHDKWLEKEYVRSQKKLKEKRGKEAGGD